MDANDLNRPAPWGETLLALGPIFFFALLILLIGMLAAYLDFLNKPIVGLSVMFTLAGLFLVAILVGLVKEFPRWVFPYWGFAILVSFYFSSFRGTVSGQQFTGDWRVWTPLGAVVLFGLLWKRSLQPLANLFQSVWNDWTLLSFGFYGALPLFCFAAYDETHGEIVMRFIVLLILALGAAFYMRVENPWHRFASLVGGFSISWLVLMTHLGLYWNGRQEVGMAEPGTWAGTINWTSRFGLILMLVLVSPVLVDFLRRAMETRRKKQPLPSN